MQRNVLMDVLNSKEFEGDEGSCCHSWFCLAMLQSTHDVASPTSTSVLACDIWNNCFDVGKVSVSINSVVVSWQQAGRCDPLKCCSCEHS